jgi:hypothetical protein
MPHFLIGKLGTPNSNPADLTFETHSSVDSWFSSTIAGYARTYYSKLAPNSFLLITAPSSILRDSNVS